MGACSTLPRHSHNTTWFTGKIDDINIFAVDLSILLDIWYTQLSYVYVGARARVCACVVELIEIRLINWKLIRMARLAVQYNQF